MLCVEMSLERPQTSILKGFRHRLKLKTKIDIFPKIPTTQNVPKNLPVCILQEEILLKVALDITIVL
jgi:hypothetical protein